MDTLARRELRALWTACRILSNLESAAIVRISSYRTNLYNILLRSVARAICCLFEYRFVPYLTISSLSCVWRILRNSHSISIVSSSQRKWFNFLSLMKFISDILYYARRKFLLYLLLIKIILTVYPSVYNNITRSFFDIYMKCNIYIYIYISSHLYEK